ncbi:MAG: hypothetical protein ACR2P2_02075 [Nakamurella sp.]
MTDQQAEEPPPASMTTPRWWRRNRWALIVLLPILAGAAWFSTSDLRAARADSYTDAVLPAPDGWITLTDNTFRVTGLVLAKPGKTSDDPGTLPAGTTAWRLTGELRSIDPAASLCGLSVAASDGNSYSAGATALAGDDESSGNCLDLGDPDKKAGVTAGSALFLVPSDATPEQLLIKDLTSRPQYGEVPLAQFG